MLSKFRKVIIDNFYRRTMFLIRYGCKFATSGRKDAKKIMTKFYGNENGGE
ncbi:hypothetical protein SAMN05421847_1566 [Halpernia humi]|uniref:Uncharacterized protein n=1 Tax=Halpernia humi TaxID=493375 RepID=A0A1H5XUY3_9FLAO|nr:hypothetical protein SAMN05421847_1566 [Halpernia humi]